MTPEEIKALAIRIATAKGNASAQAISAQVRRLTAMNDAERDAEDLAYSDKPTNPARATGKEHTFVVTRVGFSNGTQSPTGGVAFTFGAVGTPMYICPARTFLSYDITTPGALNGATVTIIAGETTPKGAVSCDLVTCEPRDSFALRVGAKALSERFLDINMPKKLTLDMDDDSAF